MLEVLQRHDEKWALQGRLEEQPGGQSKQVEWREGKAAGTGYQGGGWEGATGHVRVLGKSIGCKQVS